MSLPDDPTLQLIIAVSIGMVLMLAVIGIGSARMDRSKSSLRLRQEQVQRDEAKKRRGTPKERLRWQMSVRLGWGLALEPYAWFLLFIFVVFSAMLLTLGFSPALTLVLALPLSMFTAYTGASVMHKRRQEEFIESLIGAMEAFSSSLKQGMTKVEALSEMAPSMPEPLRTELENAVSRVASGQSLSAAMSEVELRYPSQAMHMLVTCLHIEEGSVADSVDHIAESIRNDIRVRTEAHVQITKDLREYYMTSSLIALMSAFVLRDQPLGEILSLQPKGIIVMVAVANFLFGIVRIRRTVLKIKTI